MKKTLIALCLASTLSACGQKSLDEHVQNANDALANNDYQTAIIELKNAVKLSPDNAQARFLLGKTYLDLKQYDSAEKELERALEYGYAPEIVVPILSKVYHRTGEDKGLFKLTAKAKGIKPRELAQLKFYQVKAYTDNGQTKKAQALIDEIKQIPSGGVYAQLALVYDLIIKQELDGALIQLTQVLEKDETQVDALKLKAELHLRNRQPSDAISTYAKYVEAYPEDDDMKFILARLYSETNQVNLAEPIVDSLLEKYSKQPLLLQLKASARLNNNDPKQALDFAERALLINPEDNSSRLIAGIGAHLTNDIAKTESHLSLIASMLPAEHIALRFLADAQLRLGMSLEANETTKKFGSISENEATLMSGIGYALLRDGEVNKANEILAKTPEELNEAQALASVGTLKLSLNDVSGIVDLEQALNNSDIDKNLKPQQIEITLAQAYLSTGQLDKAMAIAEKWQQNPEMKSKGHGLAARIAQLNGDQEQAKAQYEQALLEQPNNPTLKFILLDFAPTETKEDVQAQLQKLQSIAEQHPEFIPAYVKHFYTAKKLGDATTSIRLVESQLKKVEQSSPETNSLPILLAEFYRLEGNNLKAIELFEQANTDKPAPYWKSQVLAYIATEQGSKAQQLIDRWVELAPNDPTAIVGKLSVYKYQNRAKDGLELSSRYVNELGGTRLDIKVLHAYFLIRNNQAADAQAILKELPNNMQEAPMVAGLYGQILFSEQKYDQALPKLTAAYNDKPDVMNTQYMYQTLRRIKSEQAADQFLAKHVKQNSKDEVSTLILANRLISSDPEQAITLFTSVVELNPNNPIALNNVAYLQMQAGRLDIAKKHAEQAVTLQPNNPDILDTVGLINLKLGENAQALTYLSRAYDGMGKRFNDNIFVNYIEALLVNNKKVLAERKLEQTPISNPTTQQRLDALKAKYLRK